MNDLTSVLAGLDDPRAIRRERAIKTLTSDELQDRRVIATLQNLVGTDPVEYVREVAGARLREAGEVPAQSFAPIKLTNTNSPKIALLVIGIFILFILTCVAAFVLYLRLNPLRF